MRRRLPRLKTAAASWTCSGTEEVQCQSGLFAGRTGELIKEFACSLGVNPMSAVESVVEAAGASGQPDFLQRLLKIHDDLAAIGKGEGDHATHALVVNIGVGGIVDAITSAFYCLQSGLGVVQVFVVGHYNAIMMRTHKILGTLRKSAHGVVLLTALGVGLALAGCGQKGPLYLPATPAVKSKPAQPVMENDNDVLTQPAR
jgi:predicted small lipoprotein YifL